MPAIQEAWDGNCGRDYERRVLCEEYDLVPREEQIVLDEGLGNAAELYFCKVLLDSGVCGSLEDALAVYRFQEKRGRI